MLSWLLKRQYLTCIWNRRYRRNFVITSSSEKTRITRQPTIYLAVLTRYRCVTDKRTVPISHGLDNNQFRDNRMIARCNVIEWIQWQNNCGSYSSTLHWCGFLGAYRPMSARFKAREIGGGQLYDRPVRLTSLIDGRADWCSHTFSDYRIAQNGNWLPIL